MFVWFVYLLLLVLLVFITFVVLSLDCCCLFGLFIVVFGELVVVSVGWLVVTCLRCCCLFVLLFWFAVGFG